MRRFGTPPGEQSSRTSTCSPFLILERPQTWKRRGTPATTVADLVDRGAPQPIRLGREVLVDTGVWSWVRDRRFPHLAPWFNASVSDGRIATCELVLLELTRATANDKQAQQLRHGLSGLTHIAMPAVLWERASELQMLLAETGDHRRVPPTDLLIAATAIEAGVPLVHYGRDYERIAAVSNLDQRWFVPDGSLA